MKKPIYNLDGRQDVKAAMFELTEADFRGNDNVIEFECEPGSVLIAGRIKPVTAFDGTTDTIALGTIDAPTRYGTGHNLKATTAIPVVLDDAVLGGEAISNRLRVTRTTTGTPTAGVGRVRLWLQFVKLGKADTTQGNDSAPSAPPNPGPHY